MRSRRQAQPGIGVGDELFEEVFESFDLSTIIYGINPAIDPNASASTLIDGVTQLNTNTADDPVLDFIEVV